MTEFKINIFILLPELPFR